MKKLKLFTGERITLVDALRPSALVGREAASSQDPDRSPHDPSYASSNLIAPASFSQTNDVDRRIMID